MILWFVPIILFLGIITSYTDIKESKIKNKHLVIALVYSAIVYFILTYQTIGQVRLVYFVELGVMSAASLIAGFVMWHIGIWTAGDAKLFSVYSLVVPLSVYKYGHIPYFDSLNLLVNTFLPIFLFLLGILLFRTSLKQKGIFIKKAIEPATIVMVALSLFALLWVLNILLKLVHFKISQIVVIPILFIMLMALEEVKIFKLVYIIGGISILRLILDHSVYSFAFAKEFLGLIFLFLLLRFFIIRMGFHFFTKEVDIGLLEEGMTPAEVIYLEGGEYKKKRFMFFSLFEQLDWGIKKNYLFNPAEALSKGDVTELKRISKKLGFEHLRIQQTLPFAPFLFFGVLLTVAVQGSLFVFLEKLLF